MPSRNQAMIRRDINRLDDCCQQYGPKHAALAALAPLAHQQAAEVNAKYRAYLDAIAKGKQERTQRDAAFDELRTADSRWRPMALLVVPGAEATLHAMPPSGATPDDMIRIAEDLRSFIQNNAGTEKFRKQATKELDAAITAAKKETGDATSALPAQVAARNALTAATLAANPFVVHGSEIVRAVFGPTSPQYKQFIEHGEKDAAQVTSDAQAGETSADNGSPAQTGTSAGAGAGAAS